jgi:hypothetical protein
MTGSDLMRCVDAAHTAVLLHKDEIAALDQNIGDGDHVFNLIRGIEALQNMRKSCSRQSVVLRGRSWQHYCWACRKPLEPTTQITGRWQGDSQRAYRECRCAAKRDGARKRCWMC